MTENNAPKRPLRQQWMELSLLTQLFLVLGAVSAVVGGSVDHPGITDGGIRIAGFAVAAGLCMVAAAVADLAEKIRKDK